MRRLGSSRPGPWQNRPGKDKQARVLDPALDLAAATVPEAKGVEASVLEAQGAQAPVPAVSVQAMEG